MTNSLILASVVIGGLTSQPIGHHEFCKGYPTECVQHEITAPQSWRANWTFMQDINFGVNAEIKPVLDQVVWGDAEVWSWPTPLYDAEGQFIGLGGDCEDYVLEKRARLMQRFGESNLLITVVKQADGSGHAVLTVRTDNGDFILDNLRDEILRPEETGYQFIKRQSEYHSGAWVAIQVPGATQ